MATGVGRTASTYVPGDMFYLPERRSPLPDDPEAHAHMLVHLDSAGWALLVLASSSDAEKQKGASCKEVNPAPADSHSNGLTKHTYFYGGIVVPQPTADLPRYYAPRYRLHLALAGVRESLRRGIGVDTRLHFNYTPPIGEGLSWRGHVVVLSSAAEREYETRIALILTSHRYSSFAAYQTIVPLYLADQWEQASGDVVRIERPWVASLLRRPGAALLAPVSMVRTVKHQKHIAEKTNRTIDQTDLDRIELALCASLGLTPPTNGP